MPDLSAYFSRVDAEMAKRTPDEAREFLERLGDQWERDYSDFQARIARGAPTRGSATAFDYIETIAGLDQRAATIAGGVDHYDDLRRWQEAHRTNREFQARSRAGA